MWQHVYNCVLEWRIILPITLILSTTLPSSSLPLFLTQDEGVWETLMSVPE